MNDVSREYGGALFELCREAGVDEDVLSQIRKISEYFNKNSEYVRLLSSPTVSVAERTNAVREAFGGRVHSYVSNFIMLMTERSHANEIYSCFEEYERLYNEAHNIVLARAVSAVELTNAQKEKLRDALSAKTGKNVKLSCEVNASLIGGISVYIDGKLFDGSLGARLDDMRRRLRAATIN